MLFLDLRWLLFGFLVVVAVDVAQRIGLQPQDIPGHLSAVVPTPYWDIEL